MLYVKYCHARILGKSLDYFWLFEYGVLGKAASCYSGHEHDFVLVSSGPVGKSKNICWCSLKTMDDGNLWSWALVALDRPINQSHSDWLFCKGVSNPGGLCLASRDPGWLWFHAWELNLRYQHGSFQLTVLDPLKNHERPGQICSIHQFVNMLKTYCENPVCNPLLCRHVISYSSSSSSSSRFQFLQLEAKTVGAAVSEAHVDGILKERILEDCPPDTAQSDKEHDKLDIYIYCSFYKHVRWPWITAGLESSENRCAGFRPLLLCECWQTT